MHWNKCNVCYANKPPFSVFLQLGYVKIVYGGMSAAKQRSRTAEEKQAIIIAYNAVKTHHEAKASICKRFDQATIRDVPGTHF